MPLRRTFAGLLSLVALVAHGATSTPPKAPEDIIPFQATADYAKRQGIALNGILLAPAGTGPHRGDSVVYLLELQRGAGWRQWLVRLTAARPDAQAGDPASLASDTLYTSTGRELVYRHTPAAIEIEFIGPFFNQADGAAKVTVQRGRGVVSAESLELGLEAYCQSALPIAARLKAAGITDPFFYGVPTLPKPDVIEKGRNAAAAFGLTPEEERIAFSVFFALRSFYQAASEIPACRDVLEQVIAKPSLWSVAGNLGINTNFTYGWHQIQTIVPESLSLSTPAYLLPVQLGLNNQPALGAFLIVTKPTPPLRTSAGIVAIFAEHPKEKDRRVYLRLLSAQPGGS